MVYTLILDHRQTIFILIFIVLKFNICCLQKKLVPVTEIIYILYIYVQFNIAKSLNKKAKLLNSSLKQIIIIGRNKKTIKQFVFIDVGGEVRHIYCT